MFRIQSNIPKAKDAYIVGGSIRDLLLGRSPVDYDIAVMGNPEKFAKKIAKKTGRLVKMGKPGQILIRVISENNIYDISSMNGASIEDDLYSRDFTINAMAYSLSSGEIIDPLEGMQDLDERRVRMVSKDVFKKDPVRLIRAYRLGASMGFEIEPQTRFAISDNAKLIRNSAGERIKSELFKTFNTRKSHYYLSQMVDSGLLFEIFPELYNLIGCSQNIYHQYDVFEHTMKAFSHLETILNDYNEFISEISSQIHLSFNDVKTALLKCAILLHDIGKPAVKTTDNGGNFHFHGHCKKSAEMAKKISRRLKFSNYETNYMDFIIRNHIKSLSLFTAHQKKTLTTKGLTRFFIKCGGNTPDLLLHAVADNKGKEYEKDELIEKFVEFTKNLIHNFFSVFKPMKLKSPLINGYDLINEFGLTPSPLFKSILNLVEYSRLSGKIKSRQEALILVEDFLSSNK